MKWFRGGPPTVIGVYGGAFDPPHLAHAMLPGYLLARGLVDHVLVAPVADHPLGKQMRPFADRLAMVRASMYAYGDDVEVTDLEDELARTHGGPSVSLRLLEAVAARHPNADVRLVVGSDITQSGETGKWHRWDEIVRRFGPVVVPRVGFAAEADCALPQMQSRQLRAWLASSDPSVRAKARGAVPAGAWPYLVDPDPQAPTVALIGSGHVATHVQPWLRARGFGVVGVPARSRALSASADPLPAVDAVWLLVPDPHLRGLAEALVGRLAPGTIALHGAGARRADDVLAPLQAAGHPVGTVHPICALRRERPWPSPLRRAGFGLEGDEAAMALATRLVGAQPWLDLGAVDATGRRAYHGACALVANHLAVIREDAASVLRGHGHEAAVVDAVLDALLASSLSNLHALGIPAGITGPIARGDTATVQAHLDALPADVAGLYRVLSDRLAQLVKRG
jgi:nicotinate-nucleotide adenylyltransferase